VAAAAELGDKTVTVHHGDVIDAIPPVAGPHPGLGGEEIAGARRRDEHDVAAGRHGDRPPAVAGTGKRGIREAEDQASVAHAVSVDHVVPHRHPGPRPARPVSGQLYSEHSRSGI
jgi:hypothetical protein